MSVEDKKAKIRGVLEELKARSVSHETFRPYHEKVRTALQTIDAQIESIEEQHKRAVAALEESEEDEQVKKALREQSFIPFRYHEAWLRVHEIHEQFVTWSGVAQHMARVAVEKYAEALGESKALDIERDAMRRFDEYLKRQMDFHEKTVQSEIKSFEDRMTRQQEWFEKNVVQSLLSSLPSESVASSKLRFPTDAEKKNERGGVPKEPSIPPPASEPISLVPDEKDAVVEPLSRAKDKLKSLGFGVGE